MTVGERLRQLRESLRLSQGELGGRLSVSQTAISSYEQGKRQIDADELPRFANALGVPATAFFQEFGEADREREAARKLIEDFLAWRSTTMGAEGSHSLVVSDSSPIPPVFTDAFSTVTDGIPVAA